MTSSTNRASLIERLEARPGQFECATYKALQAGQATKHQQQSAASGIVLFHAERSEAAALIREMDELLFDSLYHLRVDGAAKAYHEKVEALRAKASKS